MLQLEGLEGITEVAVSDAFACAANADGVVSCWGPAGLLNHHLEPLDVELPSRAAPRHRDSGWFLLR